MTIKETQELVKVWEQRNGAMAQNELTHIALLSEALGELTRASASKAALGQQQYHANMERELSELLWRVFSMANEVGIDLSLATIENLNRRK